MKLMNDSDCRELFTQVGLQVQGCFPRNTKNSRRSTVFHIKPINDNVWWLWLKIFHSSSKVGFSIRCRYKVHGAGYTCVVKMFHRDAGSKQHSAPGTQQVTEQCMRVYEELNHILWCIVNEQIYVRRVDKKFSLAFPMAPGSDSFVVQTRTWRSVYVDFYQDTFEVVESDPMELGFERILLFNPTEEDVDAGSEVDRDRSAATFKNDGLPTPRADQKKKGFIFGSYRPKSSIALEIFLFFWLLLWMIILKPFVATPFSM
ncbi:hypothetical protein [Arcanobacterium pluranimalium]|uniref:hypothetical protein n=1 Tax=Arcanobacterium pluranimalium TaxID=108028 RepID=UPI00195D9213|nr:hypothetical protein [Arcanobacterium pluranimalium]